jgi:hypothetical protein
MGHPGFVGGDRGRIRGSRADSFARTYQLVRFYVDSGKSDRRASPVVFVPGIRISCHGPQPTSACAAFIKESRMKLANANKLHRKSGVRFGEPGAPVLSPSAFGGGENFGKTCELCELCGLCGVFNDEGLFGHSGLDPIWSKKCRYLEKNIARGPWPSGLGGRVLWKTKGRDLPASLPRPLIVRRLSTAGGPTP